MRDWRLAKCALRELGREAASMNAERWRQVERLYHSTLRGEVGERGASCRRAARANEGMRREVSRCSHMKIKRRLYRIAGPEVAATIWLRTRARRGCWAVDQTLRGHLLSRRGRYGGSLPCRRHPLGADCANFCLQFSLKTSSTCRFEQDSRRRGPVPPERLHDP